MEEVLVTLCGTSPADPLPVWVHNNVGHCFNQLILNIIPHVFLAVISACYIGTPRYGKRSTFVCVCEASHTNSQWEKPFCD